MFYYDDSEFPLVKFRCGLCGKKWKETLGGVKSEKMEARS
jgi:hypothetical protein